MNTAEYKRVYVWQLAVRFFHWINALCIIVLIATGLIIADPPAFMSSKEASFSFWFGYIRMIHFTFAYIFVAVMLLRIYWAFAGNKFANWRVFFPFDKKGFHRMWHIIKYDILLQNEDQYDFKNINTGHNSVAAASYIAMFFLALIMIITGFSLYADNSTWFLPKIFHSIVTFFTSDEILVRNIHHISMWAFVLFIFVHVYLVFFHDWLEGRGESSSMVSGYKFVRKAQLEESKIATEQPITDEN
ncbi:MAG: Ni/Fe-hydrogenase, b-type cytochrome subunit [Chryseobacterium sp.]|nr:MAG: Ni/Fe-hydrogenase, b-type cytochrome subunit [Chryseobacterium sp.]